MAIVENNIAQSRVYPLLAPDFVQVVIVPGPINPAAINAPGPTYIIENNISGFIINDYDTNRWISVIEKNIDNNEISQLAINRINYEFNWKIIVNKYITLFNELKGE